MSSDQGDFAPALSGTTQTTVTVNATASVSGSIPSGAMMQFGGSAAPAGWVLCDGSSYDGTTTSYSSLFAAIGTTYGGTGAASFKVPDLRGRVPVGYAASGGHADVSTLGNSDGVTTANRRPKHRHSPHSHHVFSGGTVGVKFGLGRSDGTDQGAGDSGVDGGSGNANDSLDAPAYLVVNYIIKL